jgi:prepilin-type N-terminal cleavage/methylation domain-containing protein
MCRPPLSSARVKAFQGFTLAELLVALLILGEISTFTIPKIITAQQNKSRVAAAKEACAAVDQVYYQYMLNNTVDPNAFTLEQLIPNINYVQQITNGSTVDNAVGYTGTQSCGSSVTCLKMHTGGILFWFKNLTINAGGGHMPIYYDPDGVAADSGQTDGPGKSMFCLIMPNGRMDNTGYSEPSWFSW